jgi:tetrahydromethanopterin S-methyltransferase subunit G
MSDISIEILPIGTHTSASGYKLAATAADLKELVATFDREVFRPPLIISHDTKGLQDEAIANSEFAFGVPKALKVVGKKLKAIFDPKEVSPEFQQWVKDRKLTSVSSSLYLRDSPSNPNPGKLTLRHIAALGKTPPAIKGMESLQTAFNCNEFEEGVQMFTIQFSAPMSTTETADFSYSDRLISNILQRLREHLIETADRETADSIVPLGELQSITEMDMFGAREIDRLRDRIYALESSERSESAGIIPAYSEIEAEAVNEPEIDMADFEEKESRLAEIEEKIAAGETRLRRTEFLEFCETIAKGKILPGVASFDDMADFMEHLHSIESNVDFEEHGGPTPLDFFKTMIGKLPNAIEFGELAGGKPPTAVAPTVNGTFDASELDADRAIRDYCAQNGLDPETDYARAMTALGMTY